MYMNKNNEITTTLQEWKKGNQLSINYNKNEIKEIKESAKRKIQQLKDEIKAIKETSQQDIEWKEKRIIQLKTKTESDYIIEKEQARKDLIKFKEQHKKLFNKEVQ